MSLVRLVARPMLAASFISNGLSRMRDPQAAASSVQPLLTQLKKRFDVPVDAPTVARITGVAQVASGAMLAVGKFPRLSSSVLVTTFLIDALGEQIAASKASSKEEKRERMNTIVQKSSLLGGALLAAVDTAGKPGLTWRAQHAAEDLWHSVEKTSKKAMDAVPFPNS